MVHTRRVFRVVNNHRCATPEALADTLVNYSWCLCNGFQIEHLAFLNDAFSEDGAQEFAVYDVRTGRQVESLTASWMTVEKMTACIKGLLASSSELTDCELSGNMPSFAHPEGSCRACA